MKISSLVVGPFQENTYLVEDRETNDAVLIDPGDEGDRIVEMVVRSGANLTAIWVTHGHLDHVGGIAAVKRRYDVPIYLHAADQMLYGEGAIRAAALYRVPFEPPPPATHTLAEGDTLRVGGMLFDVWHTPGHSPGHVILHGQGVMFGGDLIFAGSIGRTDLPLGDPGAMMHSLKRVARIPNDLTIHPGHGPSTTLDRERTSNPFLTDTARPISRRQ
jgi:glyoxylase-like metal-dependent hydrolase (beta-lactamase superfamily II)